MIGFGRHAVLLLALTAAAPAFAQDWRVAAISGQKPDRSVYLLDAASIVLNGDTITFTTQSIFEQATAEREFDRSVTKRRGQCSTLAGQLTENDLYRGGVFLRTDKALGNLIAYKDGSVLQSVMQQVCGLRTMQAETVADPEAQVRSFFLK